MSLTFVLTPELLEAFGLAAGRATRAEIASSLDLIDTNLDVPVSTRATPEDVAGAVIAAMSTPSYGGSLT